MLLRDFTVHGCISTSITIDAINLLRNFRKKNIKLLNDMIEG